MHLPGILRISDDIDVGLMTDTWADANAFFDACRVRFDVRRSDLYLRHLDTSRKVDLVPFGRVAPEGILSIPDSDRKLRTHGMLEAFENGNRHDNGLVVPGLAAFVLLKLLAFQDRHAAKDLRDVGSVLRASEPDFSSIFDDQAFLEQQASGSMSLDDAAVWQMGQQIRRLSRPATLQQLDSALQFVLERPEYQRLWLAEGPQDPDERLSHADRMMRTLTLAVKSPE